MIDKVIEYLNSHIDVFLTGKLYPYRLSIVKSVKRKRFTEFYRIKVYYRSANRNKHYIYYWIRIVKNKPQNEIKNTLKKQFNIINKTYKGLKTDIINGYELSCCKPVAFLPDLNTHITRECSGILFNRYLKITVPYLNRKRLIDCFFSCGLWLKKFHELFRDDSVQADKFKEYLFRFQNKYSHQPDKNMDYITYCHNDYSPRNIFISKKNIDVIDFVGADYGFPEEDLIFFSRYILKAMFNYTYSKTFKQKMVRSFLTGYGINDKHNIFDRITG